MKCPFYNFDINKPCSLKKCSCNINSSIDNNCIHCYINKNGTDPVSKSVLATWYNMVPKKVEESIHRALDDVRVAKVESLLGVGNDLEFVEGSNVCVCCHNVCKNPIPIYKGSDLVYCSILCSKKLPPKLVMLMQKLGSDEKSILVALTRSFPGSIICELLDLTERELKNLFKNIFGIHINISNISFDTDISFFDKKYKYRTYQKKYALIDDDLLKEAILISNL